MKEKFLYDSLIEYAKNGRYGLHMPGHKRQGSLLNGMDPYEIDITEIEGFDNLHCARGIIKKSMDRASVFFGTDRTWFMVNGSSGGVLAAINSVTDIGDTILIGRNCHKSVYNAAVIRNLKVEYLYPQVIEELGILGGYDVLEVEKKLKENPHIKAVVITSPTYEGIVSDVKGICQVAHKYNAIVIVDAAHGAHFCLSEKLPMPAYKLGADIVIESSHKTLTSLTQTALIHLMRGRVNETKLERYLGIYQSSSPSYVLMASIDKCIRDISEQGSEKAEKLLTKIQNFRENVNNLNNIFIPGEELINKYGIVDIDLTKLAFFIKDRATTGVKLANILREEFNFEVEMEGENFVLAITSISDNLDKLDELYEALKKIDTDLIPKEEKTYLSVIGENKPVKSAYEALQRDVESVFIEESQGRISAEYVSLYPPGIPLIVPGEVISQDVADKIREYRELGLNVVGLEDEEIKKIKVVKE